MVQSLEKPWKVVISSFMLRFRASFVEIAMVELESNMHTYMKIYNYCSRNYSQVHLLNATMI